MATVTTIITAGGSHPNDEVILPIATLTLWENSTPRWRCEHRHDDEERIAAWAARAPQTFLEDGLLTLAAVSLRDERVVELLDRSGGDAWRADDVDIARVIGDPDPELRSAVLDAVGRIKLVITVLPDSGVLGQLGVLEEIRSPVEVCTPVYWRRSNQWRPEVEVAGHLP